LELTNCTKLREVDLSCIYVCEIQDIFRRICRDTPRDFSLSPDHCSTQTRLTLTHPDIDTIIGLSSLTRLDDSTTTIFDDTDSESIELDTSTETI
jgi:hypothetical protein